MTDCEKISLGPLGPLAESAVRLAVPRMRRKIGILRSSGPMGLAILLQIVEPPSSFFPTLPMESFEDVAGQLKRN